MKQWHMKKKKIEKRPNTEEVNRDGDLWSCAYYAKSDAGYKSSLRRNGFNQSGDYKRGIALLRKSGVRTK